MTDKTNDFANPTLISRLVLANKILYQKSIVDGMGHVSVKCDNPEPHFLLSKSKAPPLIQETDILVHDLEGRVEGNDSPLYLERFIHSEIYRVRPDVGAVVHCHSKGSVIFGVTGQRLRPVSHMAGFLGSGSKHFEMSDLVGDSNLLITNKDLARSLASQLGQSTCVLMRGHGMTVVGGSLEEAVYRAIYAEANAALQLAASASGRVRFLSEAEAEMTGATSVKTIERSWPLWCAEAQA